MSSSSTAPTSTPSLPSSSSTETYTTLLTHLSPQTPIVLEIEILPPSFSPTILTSGLSIGIPRPLLVSSFLHTRSIFLSYITQNPLNSQNDHGKREGSGKGRIASQKEALDATLLILLFDAGYISALNLRKRWLNSLRNASTRCNDGTGKQQQKVAVEEAVHREMIWLESLVTSPLFRHAKSSTLWAHRLWVVRTFLTSEMVMKGRGFVREGEEEGKDEGRWCAFVGRELDIVMRAGERHPGNYHAWNYAREVVRLFVILSTRNGCKEREDDAIEAAWRQWIELVHRWCFGHPRDMSGWAFLSFLLDQHVRFTEHGGKGMNGDVFRRTQEFKGKLKWEGECVEWFLRSASRFQIGINNE